MRLEKWFISNLDDSQRQIIIRDPYENLIVHGSAGSRRAGCRSPHLLPGPGFGTYSGAFAPVFGSHALRRISR